MMASGSGLTDSACRAGALRHRMPRCTGYDVKKAGIENRQPAGYGGGNYVRRIGRARTTGVLSIQVIWVWRGAITMPARCLFAPGRSEEHTSELQSLMRISYAVFCLEKKNTHAQHNKTAHK